MPDGSLDTLDTAQMLAALKPFQHDTVDYAFRRLYTDHDCTRRFLVADEVGLGKTLVARGVIARAIDHLQDEIQRIDVIYICSNADIAAQNLQRLNLCANNTAGVGRLTMLPALLPRLDPRLNFVAFTPGTSFNMGTSAGNQDERKLLYWMLENLGRLPTNARGSARNQGAAQLFQAGVHDLTNWRRRLAQRWLPGSGWVTIESTLLTRFDDALRDDTQQAALSGRDDLQTRINAACAQLKGRHPHKVETPLWRETQRITGALRRLLADACMSALEPDLVIVDEFQRFKDLLDPNTEAGALAHRLFDYSDDETAVRTLLLSATPYKMYTLHAESDEDQHYRDLMQTLRFLTDSDDETAMIGEDLKRMRRALYRIPSAGVDEALSCRASIEQRLGQIMVRSERARASDTGDDMISDVTDHQPALSPADAGRYLGLQRIIRAINGPDMIDYWKSASHLLNFMGTESYQVKRHLREAIKVGNNAALDKQLSRHRDLLLSEVTIRNYEPVIADNARLRNLLDDIIAQGLWRMLWLPPSLAPYQLEGAYAHADSTRTTKRLIFSAWRVVPKTIAALISYEVERRLHKRVDDNARNTREARKAQPQLLSLGLSEGEPRGMPLFTLLYPSDVLARIGGEALTGAASEAGEQTPRREVILAHAESAIQTRLDPHLQPILANTRPDEAWYWAAPILLDLLENADQTRQWWQRRHLAQTWAGNTSEVAAEGWQRHLEYARAVAKGWLPEGPPPTDLVPLLAEIAVAGPATSALRSVRAVTGHPHPNTPDWLRDGAARIGWAYRRLFNRVEATQLIRGEYAKQIELPYWRLVLQYGLDGGLSAVNDEYCHMLAEAAAAGQRSPEHIGAAVVTAFEASTALSARQAQWDEINMTSGRATLDGQHQLRTHFAARFGQAAGDDDGIKTGETEMRTAFNSPFWPFVLASTSVGQEGLDFHPYCHAVVHWNLPSNPVDMEQREGRIHRYKGHAVRKNIARQFQQTGRTAGQRDRWQAMFDQARDQANGYSRGLVPEWNYACENGARIERHVPMLPFSRDTHTYERLRRSLAAYRMVFGQARQEDLVAYLLEHIGDAEMDGLATRLRIDLTPPAAPRAVQSPSDE